MEDRNKSTITHVVTAAVARYLDECGFKPVETEVWMPICPENNCTKGWIADVAGVISPTQTELIDMGFLKRPPSWNELYSKTRSEKKRLESEEKQAIFREQRKSLMRRMTCLVEVKTSRSDFIGDRKWKYAHWPTDLAYIAVPAGMIKPEEYPSAWGVLEYSEGNLRRIRCPVPMAASIEQHLHVIYQLAIRRDHHTRYERQREWNREQRIRDGEEKTLRRVYDLTRMVLQIAKGEHGSVEAVLDRHQLKNVPAWEMEQLQLLWGVATPKSGVSE